VIVAPGWGWEIPEMKVQLMTGDEKTICLSPEWDESNGRPMRWVVARCEHAKHASLIVTACNAHDDLVAALKNCAPYYAVMGEATIFAIEAALAKAAL